MPVGSCVGWFVSVGADQKLKSILYPKLGTGYLAGQWEKNGRMDIFCQLAVFDGVISQKVSAGDPVPNLGLAVALD